MNSVLITKSGEIAFGKKQSPDKKKLGANQVLIKVEAAALNPSDILFMRGKYNMMPVYPYTPGWEGSGTVVAVGPGLLNQFLMGKRVAFMKQNEFGPMKIGGAMADYCVTTNKSIIPLTDDFTFEQASSFFVNPLTAICMVDRVK